MDLGKKLVEKEVVQGIFHVEVEAEVEHLDCNKVDSDNESEMDVDQELNMKLMKYHWMGVVEF